MAHCPLGLLLIPSCFNAHSAADVLAEVSGAVAAESLVLGGVSGALAAGAEAAGAAWVAAGCAGAGAAASCLVSLFLQPTPTNMRERTQQTSMQCLFIMPPR